MRALLLLLTVASIAIAAGELINELPRLVPGEPNLYIAAEDFLDIVHNPAHEALIGDFGKSELWEYSIRTRQLRKLSGKIDDLSHLIGAEFSEENLRKIMRGPTAMAFYGIGDIEFLYLSKVGSVPVWLNDARFESSTYKGIVLKTASNEDGIEAAYALVDGYLIAGNRVEIVKKSLDLKLGEDGSLAQKPQFANLLLYLPEALDLVAYLNMDSLTADQYWQRYWFQSEQSPQTSITGAIWGYQFSRGEDHETRVLSYSGGLPELFSEKAGKPLSDYFPKDVILYHELTGAKPDALHELAPYFQAFFALNLELPKSWVGDGAWGLLMLGDIKEDIPQFVAVTALRVENCESQVSSWIESTTERFDSRLSYGNAPALKPEQFSLKGSKVYSIIPIPGTDLGLCISCIDDVAFLSTSTEAVRLCIEAGAGKKSLSKNPIFRELCPNNGHMRTYADLETASQAWRVYFKLLPNLPGWNSWWARTKTDNETSSIAGALDNFRALGDVETVEKNITETKRIYRFK